MPDQIYGVTWNGAEKVSYTYDPLGRLTNRKVASFSNAYTYEDVGEDKTTTLVKSVVTPAGTYSYTYDNIGNILSITDGTYTATYAYDPLNQLVRANDARAGKTYTYSYSNGNITEQKEYAYTTGELGEVLDTKSWSYGDTVWSDLLTDFNGTAITYDKVGNPLTIGSKELSWLGRQLTQITDGEEEISYAYNGDGQRVSKTVNGTTTEYIYNGDILAGQKTGDDILVFMYDNNGDPFGFICNGTEYYYIKNAQNDVTAIASADGTIIANYYYDSWGKLTEITGDTEIAELNPIRYRSYYYDSETEWYYLNTRYYSPELCRFINADEYVYTGQDVVSCNMFVYCSNDPINKLDLGGNAWSDVKRWFKNKWKSFKNWASNTFGADMSFSSTSTLEQKVTASMAPISVRTGVKNITSVSGPNSSKPVCVYYNVEVSNIYKSSTVGIKININKLKFDLSLGRNNVGISGSYMDGDMSNGWALRLNPSMCRIEIENYTIKWDQSSNLSQKSYTSVDVDLLTIFSLYSTVTSGQGANNYQPAPAYGY